MIGMSIILDGDNAWPDLRDKPDVHHVRGMSVAALAGGMTSGMPSVCFRIDLPDGSTVLAETSGRLFITAARAIAARFPELEADGLTRQ